MEHALCGPVVMASGRAVQGKQALVELKVKLGLDPTFRANISDERFA